MKKSLAFLTVATLLIASSGCGCCRGMFGKSTPVATTMYSPCAPTCAPTCAPACSAAPSCSTGSCGCESGTPVTYGYSGGGQVPLSTGTTFESTPMTFPTGSGTYGQ
ncbi:MAG: hypothetical protein ACR2NM_06180 [Bythopirellula sp.]